MRDFAPNLSARRPGFTLVELMVSIVLVLILILGINQVFKIATDSVGAGQAMSDQSRDHRAVQTVLYNDLAQSIIRSPDSPCFVIRSYRKSAFLDQEEMLSDSDYMALPTTATRTNVDTAIRTIDLNEDNDTADAGESISPNDLRQRNYRQDVMCFFARYLYPRQTGNTGTYAANMSANEAWIWYGHLRQPEDFRNLSSVNYDPGWDNGTVTPTQPETPRSSPNNFFARQWGLGRVAVLLVQPDLNYQILDKAGVPQVYHVRRTNPPASTAAAATSTTPLSQQAGNTTDGNNTGETGIELAHSRYDLAGTTIDGYRTILTNAIAAGNATWYGGGGLTPRMAGYPFPTKPLNSYGVARTVPWLIGGCTSFIVEYAGDYVAQDETTGAVTGDYTTGAVDGLVDFIQAPGAVPPTRPRRIRWYGYPRDTGTAPTATVPIPVNAAQPDAAITLQATPATVPASPDVLPLRDFMPAATPPAHERFSHLPTTHYANPSLDYEYVAAWQPSGSYAAGVVEPPAPKMIRVTMTIDDPRGRLPGGTVYEYVIELP